MQVYGQGLTRIEKVKGVIRYRPDPVKSSRRHEAASGTSGSNDLVDTCWIASHDTSGFCFNSALFHGAVLGLKSGDPGHVVYYYAGSFALQYPDVSRRGMKDCSVIINIRKAYMAAGRGESWAGQDRP